MNGSHRKQWNGDEQCWKFCYTLEISLYREIFSIIENFRYVAKILLIAKVSAPCFCVQMTPFFVFLISTLVVAFSFSFFGNFPCSEPYIS